MKKIIKNSLLGLAGALVIMQFFHPKPNNSGDDTKDISKSFDVPADVQLILQTSCFDCHSNSTRYPWYAKIQPVDWWLTDHINEGKYEVNFSKFSEYRAGRQYRKFDEIIKQVEENEMPLLSYTWLHGDAKLSETQKTRLISWAKAQRDTMEAHFPKDSLATKNDRRPPPPH